MEREGEREADRSSLDEESALAWRLELESADLEDVLRGDLEAADSRFFVPVRVAARVDFWPEDPSPDSRSLAEEVLRVLARRGRSAVDSDESDFLDFLDFLDFADGDVPLDS